MNIQGKLQKLVDRLKTDYHYDWRVERKHGCWYLVTDEFRYIGDEGENMGETYEEAVKNIKEILG